MSEWVVGEWVSEWVVGVVVCFVRLNTGDHVRAQVHAAISSLHPTSLVCICAFVCVHNVPVCTGLFSVCFI